MIPPQTTILNRLFSSAWLAATLAFLIAGAAEWYSIEAGSP